MWLSQKGSGGLLNIQRENIVSSREKRREEAWWYMIKPSLHLHQSPSVFLIFKPLFVTIFQFHCHFFRNPWRRFEFQTEISGKFVAIYFWFYYLFTYSSLCRKDHFADKNIACDQPALLFHRPPTFVLFPKNKSPDSRADLGSLLDQVMWQRRFCKAMG